MVISKYFIECKKHPIKNVAFLICFIFFFTANTALVKAQGYFDMGYKAGIFLAPKGLNTLIKDYNILNPTGEFKTVHTGHGFKLGLGAPIYFISDQEYFITGLQWLRNVQTVGVFDSVTNLTDYRRLVVHYGGIMIGWRHVATESFAFGFETNAFNYLAVKYQHFTTAKPKFGDFPSNEVKINDVSPDICLFVQFTNWLNHAGLSLNCKLDIPYLGKNDLQTFVKEWKLNTDPSKAYMRGFNFNINLSLLIGQPDEAY